MDKSYQDICLKEAMDHHLDFVMKFLLEYVLYHLSFKFYNDGMNIFLEELVKAILATTPEINSRIKKFIEENQ